MSEVLETGAPAQAVADPDSDAAAALLRQFRIVLKAVHNHFGQVERVTGIGGSQVWALSRVAASPGIGVSALARELSVRQPTASVLVRNLIQRRLLESVPNPQDRRSLQLYATAAGQLLLQRAPQPFNGVLPQALAQLDPDTQARLRQDLGTLIAALDADPSAAAQPLDQL